MSSNIPNMLSFQDRIEFNGLRTDFYVSGRILFLNDEFWTGAIMFGYAIESFLKQALLELGNKKHKLQHSHDLKLLLKSCQEKGIFKDIDVPNDFIDFTNSLFQMRYPSTIIKESHKAYERNNVIALEKSYLFCFDDYFQQLDECLFKLTNDHYSSSIQKIFASLNKDEKMYGLYFNSAVLSRYEIYKGRARLFFPKNKRALEALENTADYFWTDGGKYKIYAGLDHYSKNRELLNFVFPGKVHRDKDGNITGFTV